MTFILILIIIIALWPWISKWLKGFMSRRAEDAIRRMMGMPTRKEQERRRKQSEKRQAASSRRDAKKKSAMQEREADRQDALRSMKENAVDVEYTEYKEFSQTKIAVEDQDGNTTVFTENQVTDVEFVEIKEPKNSTK